MNKKYKAGVASIAILWLVSVAAQVSAQQQGSNPDMDRLQQQIAELQAELERMRSQTTPPIPGEVLPNVNAQRPTSELLPPPASQNWQVPEAAAQAPSLEAAPSFAPGQAPTDTLIVPPTVVVPPRTTTTTIIESSPVEIIEERRKVLVEMVPVYRVPTYRPPYSGYSTDYDCPYSRRSYRPPYADYFYERYDVYRIR